MLCVELKTTILLKVYTYQLNPELMKRKLPKPIQQFLLEVAGISKYFWRFWKEVFVPPYEMNEITRQAYSVGFKSMPLVSVTAFIMGLVIVIQSRPALIEFGAGSYIPSMSALSIIREVGPLITALVCAGNIGSSISAELGSMKVTEQIDSMEVSGTNPFKFLAVSRIIACTIMIPVIVIYADVISLFGSYAGANIKGEISFNLFFAQVFERLSFNDVSPAFIKSFFFGFSIGLIGCYKGFTSTKGTEGAGKAANSSVVISLFLVILLDMVAVQVASIFNII